MNIQSRHLHTCHFLQHPPTFLKLIVAGKSGAVVPSSSSLSSQVKLEKKSMSALSKEKMSVFNPFHVIYHTTSFATPRWHRKSAFLSRSKEGGGLVLTMDLACNQINLTHVNNCSTILLKQVMHRHWTRACRTVSSPCAQLGQC